MSSIAYTFDKLISCFRANPTTCHPQPTPPDDRRERSNPFFGHQKQKRKLQHLPQTSRFGHSSRYSRLASLEMVIIVPPRTERTPLSRQRSDQAALAPLPRTISIIIGTDPGLGKHKEPKWRERKVQG